MKFFDKSVLNSKKMCSPIATQLSETLISLPNELIKLIDDYLISSKKPAEYVFDVMNDKKLNNTQKIVKITHYCLALFEEDTSNDVAGALQNITNEQKEILFKAWENDFNNIALKWYYYQIDQPTNTGYCYHNSRISDLKYFINHAYSKQNEWKLPSALLHALEIRLVLYYAGLKYNHLLVLQNFSLNLDLSNTLTFRADYYSRANSERINLCGADFCSDVKTSAKQLDNIVNSIFSIIPCDHPFYPAAEYFKAHKKFGVWQTALSPQEVFYILHLMFNRHAPIDYGFNQADLERKEIKEKTKFSVMLAEVVRRVVEVIECKHYPNEVDSWGLWKTKYL